MDFVRSFLDCNHRHKNGSNAFFTTLDGINIRVMHCRECGLKIVLDKRVDQKIEIPSTESVEDRETALYSNLIKYANGLKNKLQEKENELVTLRCKLANVRSAIS